MTLQQLRYLRAVVDAEFSLSRAAVALGTSQPAISKQLRALEKAIGTDVVVRRTNWVIGLTAAGEAMITSVRRTLWEADNVERIVGGFNAKASGKLVLGTTHMYARYILRDVITQFVRTHPEVELVIRQGVASMIAEWVAAGDVDIGLSGKPVVAPKELAFTPLGALDRSVIVPAGHALLREKKLTLGACALPYHYSRCRHRRGRESYASFRARRPCAVDCDARNRCGCRQDLCRKWSRNSNSDVAGLRNCERFRPASDQRKSPLRNDNATAFPASGQICSRLHAGFHPRAFQQARNRPAAEGNMKVVPAPATRTAAPIGSPETSHPSCAEEHRSERQSRL